MEPNPSKINFDSSSKMMFALGIPGLDLGDPSVRYFDFRIAELYTTNSFFYAIQNLDMVPCTR